MVANINELNKDELDHFVDYILEQIQIRANENQNDFFNSIEND